MIEGLTGPLCLAAIILLCCGTFIASRVVSPGLALGLALIRVGVPFSYFAFFDHGQWRFIDDLDYFYLSLWMLERGYSPFTSWWAVDNNPPVSLVVGSAHTLYYWHNILSFKLFGPHYFSPVLLNVGITFLSGYVVSKIAETLGFSSLRRRFLFIFFILHWEIVAWSSFVNLKDCVVQLLTVTSFLCIFRLVERRQVRYFFVWCGLMFIFTMIRYYVPVLMGAAVGAWVLLQWKDSKKYFVLGIILLAVLLFKPWETTNINYFALKNPLYSMIRFLLMPQFWTVESPGEDFIEVPQFFHWIMFVPMLFGILHLSRDYRLFRMLAIYFVIIGLFYAVVPDLQGVRQRFQISFIIVFGQFQVIYLLFVSNYSGWIKSSFLCSSTKYEKPPEGALLRSKSGGA